MSEPKSPAPPKSAPDDREAKLATALRDNLRRRKAAAAPKLPEGKGDGR
jgi:hypothetical protein